MKKYLLSVTALALFGVATISPQSKAQAQTTCTEIFISEYVEGSQNNKAIELYNPTNQAVDLSNYRITRWSNGNDIFAAKESTQLSGTIQPKDVFVLVLGITSSPDGTDSLVWQSLQAKADQFVGNDCDPATSNLRVMCFNGDDAITIDKGTAEPTATGAHIDVFAKIGEDPGYGWLDANQVNWTENQTLVRKTNVQGGVTINPLNFDVTAEWDSLPRNTFTTLGWHDCKCGNAPNGIESVQNGETQIKVFPVPAHERFFVSSPKIIATAELYNSVGQLISAQNEVNYTSVEFNTQAIQTGTYFLKVFHTDKTVSNKIITIQ